MVVGEWRRCRATADEVRRAAVQTLLHVDWAPSHFDNWFVLELPVGALRTGSNTVEMWVESGAPSWQVMVAADSELLCGSEPPRQRSGEVERAGMVGRVGNRMAWARGGMGYAADVDLAAAHDVADAVAVRLVDGAYVDQSKTAPRNSSRRPVKPS